MGCFGVYALMVTVKKITTIADMRAVVIGWDDDLCVLVAPDWSYENMEGVYFFFFQRLFMPATTSFVMSKAGSA